MVIGAYLFVQNEFHLRMETVLRAVLSNAKSLMEVEISNPDVD